MKSLTISAVAAAMALVFAAPVLADGVGSIPRLTPIPENEAVQEVDGALTLGAPAPTTKPATRRPPLPAQTKPAPAPESSTRSVGTLTPPPPSSPVAARTIGHQQAPATPAVDPAAEIARMQREVEAAKAAADAKNNRPPPNLLSVKPGRNEVLSIAGQGQLNRLVTPFARPYVRTTAQSATTTVEGSVIYVATATNDPVSLFIMDEGDEVNAISLTLKPREIPSVQVTVELEGYRPAVLRPASIEQAQTFEASQAHTETLREVMKSLATGEVPPGYGISMIQPGQFSGVDCLIDGVQILPAQLVSGATLQVVVSRVQNTSPWPVEINESLCASDYTLGVAAWPRTVLQPGEATELFVAMRRDAAPRGKVRPSTLGGY